MKNTQSHTETDGIVEEFQNIPNKPQCYAMEALGTFALVLIGGFAVLGHDRKMENMLSVAFAHSLVLGIFVYIGARISGANYNPAVSIALIISKKLNALHGLLYILSQLFGSLIAGLAVKGLLIRQFKLAPSELGYPHAPKTLNVTHGFFIEVLATFFLMLSIYSAAVHQKDSPLALGATIGLTLGFCILAFGPITGAALNPARVFGPSVIAGHPILGTNWFVYYAGPVVGAIIAALFHRYLLVPETTTKGQRTELVDEEENLKTENIRN